IKTTSLALTDSRMRFATVVFPEPVPPQMPIIKLTLHLYNATMNSTHHSLQQQPEHVANTIASRHHFFMTDRLRRASRGHVCNARDAEHFQSHVTCDDRFRNGTHTYRIGAEIAQQMNLRRRFVTWTRQRTVDPAPHFHADRLRFLNHDLLQLRRVHGRHIRKPRSKTVVVWTTQRVDAHQIQVIADHHQRALAELHVDAARRVRQNQLLNAKRFESANRESDLFERIAFVEVNPALHCHDRNLIDRADHEPARVSLCG